MNRSEVIRFNLEILMGTPKGIRYPVFGDDGKIIVDSLAALKIHLRKNPDFSVKARE